MAKTILICFLLSFIAGITHFTPGNAISSCNGTCRTLNDCAGNLICINGKCGDDPNVGSRTCSATCRPYGTLYCSGKSYPQYTCSPPVSSSTAVNLTNNDFSEGGDGGAPSECDERYHNNSESVVALSTGWYAGVSRCGRWIRIVARNGRSTRRWWTSATRGRGTGATRSTPGCRYARTTSSTARMRCGMHWGSMSPSASFQ